MFFKFDVNKIWSFKFGVAQLSPVSRVTQTQLPDIVEVEVKWALLDQMERGCMLSLQFLLVQIVLYIELLGIDIEDRIIVWNSLTKGQEPWMWEGWLSQLLSLLRISSLAQLGVSSGASTQEWPWTHAPGWAGTRAPVHTGTCHLRSQCERGTWRVQICRGHYIWRK